MTYKKKTYSILTAFVLACFIIYSIAIKETINAKKSCAKLEDQLKHVENAPVQIAELDQKTERINKVINANKQNKSFNEYLLDRVSDFSVKNSLLIKHFPKNHSYAKGDYSINTNIITVEGSYIKLLKLLHHLEIIEKTGHLSSVEYLSYLDRETKKMKLEMKIYIQTIENNIYDKEE